MGDATHISRLDHKTMGQLTLEGEIESVGIRRLELVIQAPLDGEVAVGKRYRETPRRAKA